MPYIGKTIMTTIIPTDQLSLEAVCSEAMEDLALQQYICDFIPSLTITSQMEQQLSNVLNHFLTDKALLYQMSNKSTDMSLFVCQRALLILPKIKQDNLLLASLC